MDFFTSAILGGLLYDFVKIEALSLADYMKASIKGYLFSPEELKMLSSIVEKTKNVQGFTQDILIEALDKEPEILSLLQKMNNAKNGIQVNNITTNQGAILADNHGTLNFNFNK